jgi:pectinesterase
MKIKSKTAHGPRRASRTDIRSPALRRQTNPGSFGVCLFFSLKGISLPCRVRLSGGWSCCLYFVRVSRVGLMVAGLALLVASAGAQDVSVRVSPDSKGLTAGSDEFPTIQMALDHAPQPGPGGRLYVDIAPGIYHERVMVTQNRPRTTFLGTGRAPNDVVITAAQNALSAGGTFFSATVEVNGDGFEADNVTFQNTAGNTGQAVALAVRSDRAVFKHCRFLGDQDTLFADYGRQFYLDSYVEGGVDFIFGDAAAVFEDDEIHVTRPGYVTAQSRTSPHQQTGFVFLRAHLTAELNANQGFYLGRPWRRFARVVFLSSSLPASLDANGWAPWAKAGMIGPAYYAEFESTGAGARPTGRISGSQQLGAEQAAGFMPGVFLAGKDRWNAVEAAGRLP